MDKATEHLHKLFKYNPETGILIWNVRRRGITYGAVAGTDRGDGYIRVKIKQQPHFAHRIIFAIMTGQWPVHQIDHINGNKSDNRWVNLREVTNQENGLNKWYHRAGVPQNTPRPLESR